MLPIEFTFDGPPLSLQSKNSARKAAYKVSVGYAATQVLPVGFVPVADAVEIIITYYFEGSCPDVDNIIKPIQDALNSIIYIDDSQIAKSSSRKRDINGSYKLRNASECITKCFSKGNDFIHVKIINHTPTDDLD